MSITSFDQLEADLTMTRARGYTLDCEECRRDIICLSAPIRDRAGAVVAALSVSGAAARITADVREKIAPRVMQVAELISMRMGYQNDATFLIVVARPVNLDDRHGV